MSPPWLGVEIDEAIRLQAPGIALQLLLNTPDDPERLRRGELDLAVGVYANLPPEVKTRRGPTSAWCAWFGTGIPGSASG